MCIYVCHVCAGDTESEEGAGSLGPGVEVVMGYLAWMLGTKPSHSTKAAAAERSLQALRKAMLFIACLLSV